MKKRLMTIMIAFILLTGCNGNIQGNDADAVKQANGFSGSSQNTDSQKGKNENKQPVMEGEISISAMSEMEFMTIAARQFMAKYPKVKVSINAYRSELKDAGENPSDEYKTENYRSFLNTKIMTGKAEDIIFTAFLPVKKYADMGAFEDLSRYLSHSKEINAENYFLNVLESPKDKNGKLYVLPLVCSFDVISFDKRLVSENNSKLDDSLKTISFEKASEFAQQLVKSTSKKMAFITQIKAASYLYNIIKGNLKQFINIEQKRASIDTSKYIDLLNQIKNLEDKDYFASKNDIDFYNTEYYLALKNDYDVQAAFFSLDPSSNECYAMPMSDVDGKVFANPNLSLGISSASKNKELAWEFVKYLLSDEMQCSPSFYHKLGVNKKGFESSVERSWAFYNKDNRNISKEAYKSLLENWILKINAYDTFDPVIEEIFYEENSKFFEGKQSAEDTARKLQAKVNKYLNE
jgi:multiple sugar transport system substrate-binding protein